MRLLPLLLLATAPALAAGQGAPAAAPPADRLPRFGVMFDAGVPDGGVVAAVFRPIEPLRLTFGGGYNGAAYGFRGGAGLVPFHWPLSPSVNVEVGHYYDADLTAVGEEAGFPPEVIPMLESIGYNFASLQLGLELGSQRGFSFSVRAGLSYLWTTVHGVNESVAAAGGNSVEVEDPTLRGTLPSVKLGLTWWF